MLYYRIVEEKLYDYSDYKYSEECLETDIITKEELQEHPNKVIVGDIEIEIEVPEFEIKTKQKTHVETKTIKGLILNPNYEQEQAQKEAERVGNLTMTALDFITFLRQCGLTLEQIRAYLDSNIELDTQLKYCQNVYCKVASSVMPITVGDITITAEMVENAFKVKNGEL